MINKVLNGLECCSDVGGKHCYEGKCPYASMSEPCREQLAKDSIEIIKEQDKKIKALRLLIEWAEECGFGFDAFSDEYHRYKEEVEDMRYIDAMIHVAKRTLEDHGVFEATVEPHHKCQGDSYTLITEEGTKFCPWCGKKIKWRGDGNA